MAKGQYLTRHQQGIVKRFYEHADTRVVVGLQELLSELFLAAGTPKAEALWTKAAALLQKANVKGPQVDKILGEKNLEALGRLIAEIGKK